MPTSIEVWPDGELLNLLEAVYSKYTDYPTLATRAVMALHPEPPPRDASAVRLVDWAKIQLDRVTTLCEPCAARGRHQWLLPGQPTCRACQHREESPDA